MLTHPAPYWWYFFQYKEEENEAVLGQWDLLYLIGGDSNEMASKVVVQCERSICSC